MKIYKIPDTTSYHHPNFGTQVPVLRHLSLIGPQDAERQIMFLHSGRLLTCFAAKTEPENPHVQSTGCIFNCGIHANPRKQFADERYPQLVIDTYMWVQYPPLGYDLV
jgi:hypothetical protein